MARPSTPASEHAEKAVLFCPQCRYRAPWTEWVPTEDAHSLRCPSCDTVVG